MKRTTAALAIALTTSLWGGQRLPAQSPSAVVPGEALSRARAQGTVRIILELNVPAAPQGLSGAARAAWQRSSIATTQAAVLGRLARPGRGVKRFAFVPYLAMEVDEADLRALASQPEVQGIHVDRLSAPSLRESIWITQAAHAALENYRAAGMTVAVLDTGVDKTHAYLTGRVLSEACYSTTSGISQTLCPGGVESSTASGSGRPCDLAGCEHGTHVAGIAAGAEGVARSATLISIQVFSAIHTDCGWEPIPCVRAFDSDIIAGLERVYSLRSTYNIAAANLSLGRSLSSIPCDSEPVKSIIDQLRAAGIATVAAAGNDASPGALAVPACVSSTISVGSTTDGSSGDAADLVSTFTNNSAQLTLLAPGETITSPVPGGGFASFNGTSQAAPHVTGAWAILKEINPRASVTEVASALISTGQRIIDPRNGLTKPRIRIMDALLALPPFCTFSVTPTNVSVGRTGSSVAITVTPSQPNCVWGFARGGVSWISATVENTTQRGSQTFAMTVAVNPSGPRTGVVTVAGVAVTVAQAGGVAGDINADGRADVVWQQVVNGTIAVWYLSEHVVVGSAFFGIGSVGDPGWRIVGSGDLNGDGPSDLVWRHEGSGNLAVWYLSGTQVIETQPLSIGQVPDTNWEVRAVGDTNGDGFADLVWQHRTEGWLAVWLMAGNQVIETRHLSINRVTDTNWHVAAAGDLDGDGRADILWQHQSSGALGVWFMNGAEVGWTTPISSPPLTDLGWKIRGAGDTNGDGRADLIWQHETTGAVGVWFMAGRHVIEQRLLTGGTTVGANWIVAGPG
jgi:subtilisin